MTSPLSPTILIVPGLRDHVEQHWQTLLASELPQVVSVAPMGREGASCAQRVAAIEQAAGAIEGPVVAVAHSGGTITLAHWVAGTRHRLVGAVLVTPPDFERPMPQGYPGMAQLSAQGWLPVPRMHLPFPSIVAASRNDPLAAYERVRELAHDWGSTLVDLGEVGHLNPASGYGRWKQAHALIARVVGMASA